MSTKPIPVGPNWCGKHAWAPRSFDRWARTRVGKRASRPAMRSCAKRICITPPLRRGSICDAWWLICMRNPLANPPVLCARNHRSLACSTRRSFDVRTSLHNFPTESFIAHTADLSALSVDVIVSAFKSYSAKLCAYAILSILVGKKHDERVIKVIEPGNHAGYQTISGRFRTCCRCYHQTYDYPMPW